MTHLLYVEFTNLPSVLVPVSTEVAVQGLVLESMTVDCEELGNSQMNLKVHGEDEAVEGLVARLLELHDVQQVKCLAHEQTISFVADQIQAVYA